MRRSKEASSQTHTIVSSYNIQDTILVKRIKRNYFQKHDNEEH